MISDCVKGRDGLFQLVTVTIAFPNNVNPDNGRENLRTSIGRARLGVRRIRAPRLGSVPKEMKRVENFP